MNGNPSRQRIAIVTLGCAKNTVDSETLAGHLRANDFALESDPARADVVIVNTCGFIGAAKEESVNAILDAAAVKKLQGGARKRVFVAGCLSARYREELRRELPEVDAFFGTADFGNILGALKPDYKYALLGERALSTPDHFAYLKISEGCDNPCSFCAIPLMRGKHASRGMEEILFEVYALVRRGVKEFVLVAQDSTAYGFDLYGKRSLATLLERISDVRGVEWIRLMYAYPAKFPAGVIEIMANRNNICKYLDMPVQHVADSVLKAMRRGISRRRTMELIETIRRRVPGITLRTTLITGFPGETDADFAELLAVVRQGAFDRLGVFTYSREEHTAAYDRGDPVPEPVKNERRALLMEAQREISARDNKRRIGTVETVLIDAAANGAYVGRTERDAPEVDNTVVISSAVPLAAGSFQRVVITGAADYDLFGTIAA